MTNDEAELQLMRAVLSSIREHSKSLLDGYGDTDIMSDVSDDRQRRGMFSASDHLGDAGNDEGVSFRRVEIPTHFDTDPGHDDFSQPKQDIDELLYTMLDLIDRLMRAASPERVHDEYAELLEKTQLAKENYDACAQRYWPASENNDIAGHLFEELAIEIEKARADVTPAPGRPA